MLSFIRVALVVVPLHSHRAVTKTPVSLGISGRVIISPLTVIDPFTSLIYLTMAVFCCFHSFLCVCPMLFVPPTAVFVLYGFLYLPVLILCWQACWFKSHFCPFKWGGWSAFLNWAKFSAFLLHFFFCVCDGGMALPVWYEVRGQLVRVFLFPGDWTQVIRLNGNHLYQLSRFIGP